MNSPSFSKGAAAFVSEHVLDQELDGEIVLLDLKSGVYYGLNEVGSRMWSHLSHLSDLDEIMSLLLDEFDVDRETLLIHLHDLCHQLNSLELITLEGEFHAEIIKDISG